MSFVAPWMLVAGIVAALGVVALHLLSTRRPPAAVLPTARFVPESDVRAVARTSKPTDLLLLLLRVLAVLLLGLGFAQPLPDAPGPRVRSVVALEWTTALADVEAARRTAGERLADGDALVLFDTAARVVDAAELATLAPPTVRRAALSPVFIVAREAARSIARGADSLQLVVVSAFSEDAFDAATAALRASWPGRVERVSVSVSADTALAPAVQLVPADVNDPLAPALRALSPNRGPQAVRVQRGAVTQADSQWLASTRDAVLIHWPRAFSDSVRADGVTHLDGAGATLVAPLARIAIAASSAATPGTATTPNTAATPNTTVLGSPANARVIARWRDGSPAVTEAAVGASCSRNVGIGLPEAGDLTLRLPFAHFLSALVAPCGGRREVALVDSTLSSSGDEGPLGLASALVGDGTERSSLAPWLLVAAFLLLIAEQFLRRVQRREAA